MLRLKLQKNLRDLGLEFPPGASEQDLENILLSYWYQQGVILTHMFVILVLLLKTIYTRCSYLNF
jgi:hypothetical protein